MARLPTTLLRQAQSLNPLLPLLLRSCHDLESAQNELRWLREHALGSKGASDGRGQDVWKQLRRMCLERSKGKPLQYVLGSQPFGKQDILCRKGVLIPRPETESITQHLSSRLKISRESDSLRILDICTGTGCISLLLHALLAECFPNLDILGIDISSQALDLARQNLQHNLTCGNLSQRAKKEVSFIEGDIFDFDNISQSSGIWDVLVSNPPYISPNSFKKTTSRSVRNYEPRAALVPEVRTSMMSDSAAGDAFYPPLIELARKVQARVLLLEVADLPQAIRVAGMVLGDARLTACEIWKDWPDQTNAKRETMKMDGKTIELRGSGNGRAVFAWTTNHQFPHEPPFTRDGVY